MSAIDFELGDPQLSEEAHPAERPADFVDRFSLVTKLRVAVISSAVLMIAVAAVVLGGMRISMVA